MLNNKTIKAVFLGLSAVFAGFLNGFLGTGGGIVLLFALSALRIFAKNNVKNKFATVIAVTLPLSLLSLYLARGNLNFESAKSFILPAIAGGIIGAKILNVINVKFLKLIFAGMVLWASFGFLRR